MNYHHKEKAMNLPKDPIILLSYINTKLRDYYPSLEELCLSMSIDQSNLEHTLSTAGYRYERSLNRFIAI
jgi:hypothetical protein